jgi:DNA-binding GntR family transcriptional regulator
MNLKHTEKTLAHTFHDKLLERFLNGAYTTGDIITEKQLVDEFSVSKSPLREAMIRLSSEGLLRSIPRYGYEVLPFPEEKVRQMLSFRIVLECGFLYSNWDCIHENDLSELQQIIEQYKQPYQSEALEHWQHNCAFHLALFHIFGNAYAYEQLEGTLRSLGIAYVRTYWQNIHQTNILISAPEHKHLLTLIRENKKQEAVESLRKDIESFFTLETQAPTT